MYAFHASYEPSEMQYCAIQIDVVSILYPKLHYDRKLKCKVQLFLLRESLACEKPFPWNRQYEITHIFLWSGVGVAKCNKSSYECCGNTINSQQYIPVKRVTVSMMLNFSRGKCSAKFLLLHKKFPSKSLKFAACFFFIKFHLKWEHITFKRL